MTVRSILGTVAVAVALAPAAAAQRRQSIPVPDPKAADVAMTEYVYEPTHLTPSEATTRGLTVPAGFRVTVFATGLGNARMLAVASDGAVYVTRRDEGDVVLVRDRNGDGRADETRVVARRPQMHGIAIDGRRIYLITVNDVYVADLRPDGSLGELTRIIDDLPDGGQHANRTLGLGPDGMLYISVGSTCNACDETSAESATLLRARPDGRSRTIYASGLRNTIGFGWYPDTGELWGMDNGIDWLGNEHQREELNRLERGAQYGWPYIYADGGWNPQDEPPGGLTMAQWDSISRRPALTYTAHAAPMQMAFYDGGMFPAGYAGDAFVAMRGSWNRKPPSGYQIVRVRFDAGKPVAFEPFVTGFLQTEGGRHGQLARLAGVAVARDGALLFSDDENGVIYRVSYGSARRTVERTPTSAAPRAAARAAPHAAPARPEPSVLAMERPETAGKGALRVTSPALRSGAPIPPTYSAYGQDISPALRWTGAPAGTRSFVVLMEDPDAAEPKPFVHWIAYDIPAAATELPEALPTTPRLEAPVNGMLQGRNSRGSIGYYGPRPPLGDAAHRYHFQVFALDRTLALLPAASREEVLAAMRGHVLARGELMGRYAQSAPPASP